MILNLGEIPTQKPPVGVSQSHVGANLVMHDGVPKLLDGVFMEA